MERYQKIVKTAQKWREDLQGLVQAPDVPEEAKQKSRELDALMGDLMNLLR